MTQAERFLQFVQKRNERAIQDLQVTIRIDDDALVVTQSWIEKSAKAEMNGQGLSPERMEKTLNSISD